MIVLLYIIIVILIIIIFYINRKYKFQKKQINYISDKIDSIIAFETSELILIPTEDKTVKSLLINVNKLLDYSNKKRLSYETSKISMMKMLSNISHDLKTPLTTLKGYIEMLGIQFNDNVIITKIELRINEIIELINKFFDLVKLESGDKTLNLTKINVCEICRKNMFEFYNIITEKEIYVDINIPEKPVFIIGDRDALSRVLKNILDNAIKYGIDGKFLGLSVNVYNDIVCISIEDHGKGILGMYKEEVFERLYTLEDSRSKDYQGSGLGLTISKELVEHMNGKIELKSIPNQKTLFNIIFSLKR